MRYLASCPLVVALAGGCAAPPIPPDLAPGIVIRWSVNQALWGAEVFEVKTDGRAHYAFTPAGSRAGARSFDVAVPPEAMAHVAAIARRVGFCSERSKRDGIPDEGMPTLALALPGISCAVTLWDGEWDERVGAHEVARLVAAMHNPGPSGAGGR
jgi:hypothetical protein